MAIRIEPYQPEHEAAVKAFNARLHAGGIQEFHLPESHRSAWLPRGGNDSLYEECFLAIDEDREVRGGYILKQQKFWRTGTMETVGCIYLPLSEGLLNPRYAQVGLQLLLNGMRRQPLVYCLGMGSFDNAWPRLLQAASWKLAPLPFYFRVVHPRAFLRQITFLRRTPMRRTLLDLLALSGIGSCGIHALNYLKKRNSRHMDRVIAQTVPQFADWVDPLWESGREFCGLCAVRDSYCLNRLYPAVNEHYLKLRVQVGGQTVGWAVMLDTQLSAHKHFGNLRLGSIVDCFALAGKEMEVVWAALDLLERRQVDLVVSNQSHEAWGQAFRRCGFLTGPSNFLFGASPSLGTAMTPFAAAVRRIHFTRADGEGPSHL